MKLHSAWLPCTLLGLSLVACTPTAPKSNDNRSSNHSETGEPSEPVEKAPPPPVTIPTSFTALSDLDPQVAPPKFANIVLTSALIECQLKEQSTDHSIVLRWLTPGSRAVEIEREKYFFDKSHFAFAFGPAESYDPPITLLKFPFKVGDSYSWKGQQTIGRTKRPGTASISTSTDVLDLPDIKTETIKVNVDLNVQTGSPGGTQTNLVFWIQPGHGVVKRDLGRSSNREPRPEPEKTEPTTPEAVGE